MILRCDEVIRAAPRQVCVRVRVCLCVRFNFWLPLVSVKFAFCDS